jgi:uncharacterized protein YndB with AHSA1/START domain
MTTEAVDLTIRKSVTVAAPVERAWEVFTERLQSWWPLDTHSIGADRIEEVVVEGRAGGRVFERIRGGGEESWATVLVWEPPRRLVLAWEITDRDTEVEVLFRPEGDGTRVDLEHRGWDEEAPSRNYDRGWTHVLGRYEQAANA